jgi:uncharacterized membrane protein (DUF2068 family)
VHRILHGSGWHAAVALALNAAIVAVMLYALVQRKRQRP